MDFNPNYTIEKFTKPAELTPREKRRRRREQAEKNKIMVPKVLSIEERKKLKEEAEKSKKLKNIDKLKGTLA